jgi:hypothetical protein
MGCDLFLTKSKLPRWVKVLLTVGGILGGLILIWLAIRTIFPLPLKNEIKITEERTAIDVLDNPFVANEYTQIEHLKDGSWIYSLNIDYWNYYDAYKDYKDVNRIYILSSDFSVIDFYDFDYSVEEIFALDNGNFSTLKSIENDDESRSRFIVEYNTEFEIIDEKPISEIVRFYNDGYYYTGMGNELKIFDEDLEIVDEYSQEDFPGSMFVSFAESYDGEVFLIASYSEGFGEYDLPTAYLLHPLSGGEDVKYSLASDTMGDLLGNHPGDERYAFYTNSTNLNETLMWAFMKNIRGDYLYGINKDGSFEKIGSYDWEDGNDLLYDYYDAKPLDGKRYRAERVRDDEARTMTLYVCEYTAEYPN